MAAEFALPPRSGPMNDLASAPDFASRVLAWFDQHGRHDLPWQQDINPYRVWVSAPAAS